MSAILPVYGFSGKKGALVMVNGFQTYLQQEGYAKEKTAVYCRIIKRYMDWYQAVYGVPLKQLLQGAVWDYLSYLRIAQRAREREIKENLSVLRVFDRYLVKCGMQTARGISDQEFRNCEAARTSAVRLRREIVNAFRRQVLASSGCRDHAIVTLMAYAGLRLEECFDLQYSDIDLPACTLMFWSRKAGIKQTVSLTEEVVQALQAYFMQRPGTQSSYLFPDDQGGRLTRDQLAPVFRSYPVGMPPYVLRHFYFKELPLTPHTKTRMSLQAATDSAPAPALDEDTADVL